MIYSDKPKRDENTGLNWRDLVYWIGAVLVTLLGAFTILPLFYRIPSGFVFIAYGLSVLWLIYAIFDLLTRRSERKLNMLIIALSANWQAIAFGLFFICGVAGVCSITG